MTAPKRLVLSSDHAAISLRSAIAAHAATLGWEVVDIGPTSPESTHYPTHGEAAARRVASGDCALGIILCGTGQGIMMAANKVKGIRAALCGDAKTAAGARKWNDANVLCMSLRATSEEVAREMLDAWFENTPSTDEEDVACLRYLEEWEAEH